jgi:hypothetical protein
VPKNATEYDIFAIIRRDTPYEFNPHSEANSKKVSHFTLSKSATEFAENISKQLYEKRFFLLIISVHASNFNSFGSFLKG